MKHLYHGFLRTISTLSGDLSVLTTLLHVLTKPYDHEGSPEAYQHPQNPEDGPYRTFCGT